MNPAVDQPVHLPDVNFDPWILTASEPAGGHLYLANGYISTALTWDGGVLFESPASPCYIRGVYNDTGPGAIDRLALAPSWSQIRYGAPASMREYRRELDLRRGRCSTCFVLEEERGLVHLQETILVSRADRHQAAVHLVIRPEFDGEITLLTTLEAAHAEDVETLDADVDGHSIWLLGRTRKYDIRLATVLSFPQKRWEYDDNVGQNIVARVLHTAATAGEEILLTQLVRVVSSLETPDPLTLARRPFPAYTEILSEHERAWDQLWQTDIQVEGDQALQQFLHAALFYLWSSMREGDHWSIAPMGLSSNGYNGHIFWDAELWMYPSLLLTQPEMAWSCVAYRERTVAAAQQRALSGGCQGARFPWESAFTGEEMTPHWAEPRELQLHITADVAIAQWWYYLNTRDLTWLREHGYPVIGECAEFWVSRVEYNAAQDRYEIRDVQCADEYAAHVDNDAFTNAAVHNCLRIATRAADLLDQPSPAEWRAIADKMYVAYDPAAGITLEFDGYDGRVIKQADVELLTYPLEYITEPAQIARNLDYYATVMDPNGPAMSYSVYSVVSAQLGRGQAALDYLARSYLPNTRPPFQAFSETPTNNEFLFCTGVGGALQALLFGFSGIRLREGYFVLNPLLPESWAELRLRNIYLLGARTDVGLRRGQISLRRALPEGELNVALRRSGEQVELTAGWGSLPTIALEVVDGDGQTVRSLVAPHDTFMLGAGLDEGVRFRLLAPDGTVGLDVLLRQPSQPGRPLDLGA